MTNLITPQRLNTSFWKGRKVLVTGHTGFKGSWLSLCLLELGASVIGVSLKPEFKLNLFDQLRISSFVDHNLFDIANLQDISLLLEEKRPDVIFHLAAQSIVRVGYDKPVSTWSTNVMGTINILESLKSIDYPCSAVFVTTDKVYKNNEWVYGYRENDALGGIDPYSSSKAAAEIAIDSWRKSFFESNVNPSRNVRIASARAGNVIGGGDWSPNRIIPDVVRSISENKPILVRNPASTRPWQHVLEPLSGYLLLAEKLENNLDLTTAYNFGPSLVE